MGILKKINNKAKSFTNSGFGTNASSYGGRFISKNGNANVRKTGIGFIDSISWYHTMLNISRWKFLFIIFLFYFLVNFVFATIYYVIGVEHLRGIDATTFSEKFGQAFFFSIQTYTTVGYGHISPSGFLTSAIAAIEALIGLLSFAIATGLLYGRFSKPKAFIAFSENAIIAPYKDGKAFMFRLAPYKNTNLTEIEAKVSLGIQIQENNEVSNKFYSLDLEMDKISMLNLSWTLVHPIIETSPLYELTQSDYKNITGEFIVFIKAFDEMFSTNVVKKTSYTFDEIVYGAKFKMMYTRSNDFSKTILELDKINSFDKIEFK
jgi:inward rectifier potassium channel